LARYAGSHRIPIKNMKTKASSATLKGPQRCVCGQCASCLDNERWERIFQEKYGQQEREYYSGAREPRSSGVSAKAFADASIYACAEEREIAQKVTRADNVERFYNLLRNASYADTAA
jgi:hypothetical protein